MPVIAHSSVTIESATLRCWNICESGARLGACVPRCAAIAEGSRIVSHMINATTNPGMPTIQNTLRQVVISRS